MPCPSVALQLDHSRGIAAGIWSEEKNEKRRLRSLLDPLSVSRTGPSVIWDWTSLSRGERVRGRLLTIRSQS